MGKSLESFNYKFVKQYNVKNLANFINNFNLEWFEDTSRQEQTIHHTKTQTYFVSMFDLEYGMAKDYLPKITCDNKELINILMPVIDDICKQFAGLHGRILLINLPSNSQITSHFDEDEYFDIYRRIHLPIITNDEVDFFVDGEYKNMKVGECWEINNKKLHSVFNKGQTNRVHLVMDIIPNML